VRAGTRICYLVAGRKLCQNGVWAWQRNKNTMSARL
jgi:hypothetical protein